MDLEMLQIAKSFSGVNALKGVDFCANFGEVHALLGENGAGKSTLIKILSGSLRADSGTIHINGKQVSIQSPKEAMNAGIGTVYQELSLIPSLSVAQNTFLLDPGTTKFGVVDKKLIERKTQELLDEYGITEIKPTDLVRDLDLPSRQITEIIKTLAKDPSIVIFDEATSALSEHKVQWLLQIARKLAGQNKLVIFISHRMAEIREGCNCVTVFRNGENVGNRKINEADNDELVAMMLGRRVAGYYPPKENSVSEDIMLETRGLRVGNAVNGVDLQLHRGEVMGIGGLAGQGQSELFRALTGILPLSDGEILIDGERKTFKSPADSIKNGVALIPEDRSTQGLVLPLSIRHNITLPILKKIKKGLLLERKKEKSVLDEYMHRLEIKNAGPDRAVMTLSGGNQQKVVFAKMFATEPHVLLLYDCTRGVDVGTKAEIFNLVRRLAREGEALLYYSTDVEELVNVCDRVAVMHDGCIGSLLEGEWITKENIILASVGEKINEARGGAAS